MFSFVLFFLFEGDFVSVVLSLSAPRDPPKKLKTTNSKIHENKQCGSLPATMIFSLFYLLFTDLPEPQRAGGLEEVGALGRRRGGRRTGRRWKRKGRERGVVEDESELSGA